MKYSFTCRPEGLDRVPGCFVCGYDFLPTHRRDVEKDDRFMLRNVAAFVKSREDGDAIVKLFGKGAVLDYRDSEPHRIQLKFGVCDLHIPALTALRVLSIDAGYFIDEEMIQKARAEEPQEHLVIKADKATTIGSLYIKYCADAYAVENGYMLYRAKSRDQVLTLVVSHQNLWDEISRATDIYKLKDLGDWGDWKFDPVRMIVIKIGSGV